MVKKRWFHAPRLPQRTPIFVLIVSGSFPFWLLVDGCRKVPSPLSGVLPTSNVPLANPMDRLSPQDNTTLINITDFYYIINHDPCASTQPLLLILIHSAPKNLQKRNAIRATWGQKRSKVVLLFLLGANTKLQTKLKEEDRQNNDMVQGSFLDAYRNMTYKHVMALKWAIYHCSDAKYILKVDDDVFVNVEGLIRGFSPVSKSYRTRCVILCSFAKNLVVQRQPSMKWRTSRQEYPDKYYPNYCTGWGILYSMDSAYHLYRQAEKEPYFWIDDIHVTGTLAKKVQLTLSSFTRFCLTEKKMAKVLKKRKWPTNFIFGPPDLSVANIKALWNVVTKRAG